MGVAEVMLVQGIVNLVHAVVVGWDSGNILGSLG